MALRPFLAWESIVLSETPGLDVSKMRARTGRRAVSKWRHQECFYVPDFLLRLEHEIKE